MNQLDLFAAEPAPRGLRAQHGTWGMQTLLEVLAEPVRRCYQTVSLDPKAPWWAAGHYIANCENIRAHQSHGLALAGLNYTEFGRI